MLDLGEFQKCQADIVYFAENHFPFSIFGKKTKLVLTEKQKEVLRAYENGGKTIVSSCRQSGKSLLSLIHTVWRTVFFPNQDVGVIFHSEDSRCWYFEYLMDIIFSLSPDILSESSRYRIKFDNYSEIQLINGTSDIGLRGRNFNFYDLQEAAYILTKDFWYSVYPVVSAARSGIMISSTKRQDPENLFYQLYLQSFNSKSGFTPIGIDVDEEKGKEWCYQLGRFAFEVEFLAEFPIKYPVCDSQVKEIFLDKEGNQRVLCDDGLLKIQKLENPFEDCLNHSIYNTFVSQREESKDAQFLKIVIPGTTEEEILKYYNLGKE